jgi:hypothetical protein
VGRGGRDGEPQEGEPGKNAQGGKGSAQREKWIRHSACPEEFGEGGLEKCEVLYGSLDALETNLETMQHLQQPVPLS